MGASEMPSFPLDVHRCEAWRLLAVLLRGAAVLQSMRGWGGTTTDRVLMNIHSGPRIVKNHDGC